MLRKRAMGLLRIETIAENGRWRMRLRGDLDMMSAQELADAVRGVCEDDPQSVLIDMQDVEFVDSSGVRALLLAHEFCAEREGSLLIDANLPDRIARVFDIAGVTELFNLWRGEDAGASADPGSAASEDAS